MTDSDTSIFSVGESEDESMSADEDENMEDDL